MGPAVVAAAVAAAVPCSTTHGATDPVVAADLAANRTDLARHPQDGPHCDLKFRLEGTVFTVDIAMNLVFLDWMIAFERESEDQVHASELPALEPKLRAYFSAQMPVTIDGVRVDPRIGSLAVNDPDEVLLPLFPISGWRGLRKVSFTLTYPIQAAPDEIGIVWPAYPPDLLSVLPSKPPLEIASEWTADGLRTQVLFTRDEPGFTWHRPSGGIDARLERVPAPAAPRPLIPPAGTLALVVFVVGFGSAAIARKRPLVALATGLLAAGIVMVLRPTGPGFLAIGTRAAPGLGADEATKTFEALHANLYRAFDYEDERSVYDALARSVSGELLEETYLSVRRALVMEEEGGAMSRVVAVRPISTRIDSQGEVELADRRVQAFVVSATWRVDGRVTHWGHAHDRTNEYDGRFTVCAEADGWRIHDAEITRQERVDAGQVAPPPAPSEDEEL